MSDRFSAPYELETKFANGEAPGTFAGYASTFGGSPDSYGDLIAPGSFAHTLRKHADEGSAPAMLWAHDPGEPIGKWLSVAEDRSGLAVKGKLTLETQRGADAYALMKDGALGLSIGYRTLESKFERNVRVLTKIQLFEASLVAMPANPAARVMSVKSAFSRPDNIRDFESLLRDVAGFSARESKRLASGGWHAFERRDDEEAQQVAALLKSAAHEFRQEK